MKKNKKNLIAIAVIIAVAIAASIIIGIRKDNKNKEQTTENENVQETLNKINEEYEQIKENSKMYNEDANITTLKEEYKMTGDNDIYEIIQEADGRKILTVKSDLNFKVAFAGMIKNDMPKKEEVNIIYEQNFPKSTGIYVNKKDCDKILQYLNNNKYLNNKYRINNDGFIEIEEKKNETESDKKIEKIIKGSKTYIVSINGTCYMIDTVTGEIIDNPYRDIEEEQIYEYFEDENKLILFITDSPNILQDEIFYTMINFDNN